MKIIKIAPYIPVFNWFSKYESYEYITKQEYSPSIEKQKATEILKKFKKDKFENIRYLYCSTCTRWIETAYLIKQFFNIKAKIIPNKCLNEIKFSIKNLISKKEFETYWSIIVRKSFIDRFINNSLIETRTQIKKRINILEKLNKNSLFISHSFFMKIIQIYNLDNNLFNNPEILKNTFNIEKKTFEFLELLDI